MKNIILVNEFHPELTRQDSKLGDVVEDLVKPEEDQDPCFQKESPSTYPPCAYPER